MTELSELLRRVPVFVDLPDDQISWFLSQSQDLQLKAGEYYARQGLSLIHIYQLFWLDEDPNGESVFLGPIEQQGTLTGLPALKVASKTGAGKHQGVRQ